MTEAPSPTESAVIVAVPAAEPVVGDHRRLLDPAASRGVPAHVTVLYPFLPPDRIVADTVETIRSIVADVPAFGCTFSRIGWFDDDVAWLDPEPAAPFRQLTRAVWDRFPDHPPYGGAYADSVPHLTIGHAGADPDGLRRAAAEVQRRLPVRAWIDRVSLIAGTDAPGSWRTLAEFAMGTAAA